MEAGHGFADLEPLKTVIGDARIVALGECTHGSREIFAMDSQFYPAKVQQLYDLLVYIQDTTATVPLRR